MQITYADLRFQKQIGEGSFGRVYLAKWRETTVAVKLLHRQLAEHQDDDLPAVSSPRDDPILAALQRVRCGAPSLATLGWQGNLITPEVMLSSGFCSLWVWESSQA